MHLFILGVVFGVGLMLAYEEIQLQLWLHKETKRKNAQDQAIAMVSHPAAWNTPLPDQVGDTCYCHASWDDHEAWMLKGTTATTSTPDTQWWDVLGVDGKPSGIKVEKPKDEDYW